MDLTKRSIKVEITKYNDKNEIVYQDVFVENISVKFTFEKYIGNAMYGEGKVSICGLKKETVSELTTINSIEEALKERKEIKVYAGYGENQALIIDGTIISAVPTIPPDVWLECEIMNGYERTLKMYSVSVEAEMNIKELAETIAKQLDLKNGVDCRIKNDVYGKRFYQRTTKNISKVDTMANILSAVMETYSFQEGDMYGVPVVYIDNETLIVDYSLFDSVESQKRTHHKINKENGMLGLPEISEAGLIANITTLLKPEIKAGDVIDLESEMIPKANGQYTVLGTTYVGDYRGNSWYSTFSCRRIYQ